MVCGGRPNPNADPALGGPAPGVIAPFCSVVVRGYPVVTSFGGGAKDSWDNVSYRVALTQKLGADWRVYASYATGYKSGGFPQEPNTSAAVAFTPFGAEHIGTVEVGAKGSLLDNRLRASVAIYHSDYTDIEADVTDPGTGAVIIANSHGGATIDGVEAQIDWRVTERFMLTANASYLDARFNGKGLRDASGAYYATSYEEPAFGRFTDLPKWKAYVASSYTLPLDDGSSVRFFGDVRFSGKVQDFIDAPGTPVHEMDTDWTMKPVVGANVTWTDPSGNISVQFWGKNLTNADDWLERRDSFLFDSTAYKVPGKYNGLARAGDPRTYGMSLNFRFN